MCFMEITTCGDCKKKHDYTPSFCEKMQKGIMCVDKDIPTTRDTRHNQTTLTASIRFDDRFNDMVMYLSDIMVTYEIEFPCDKCVENSQREAGITE
jgi:hypothetical protein